MNFSPANMRMWSRLGPSGTLGAVSMELGSQYEDTLFVTADMCFAAGLERFKNNYPDRIYNTGIAEQNLIGVSAGLASEGYNPYAVTYATFLATRALDQVKMCLGYMKLPVKMIGLNAGFAAGILGPTHMALEDISAMRAIPNIIIVSPADMTEFVKVILATHECDKPVYIRLTGEMNQSQVYSDDYEFEIGKAVTLRQGDDVTIIANGVVVDSCCKAADIIKDQGIECRVVNMHTIKPIDTDALDEALKSKLIVTVEEHNVFGGLGSAVADYLGDKNRVSVLQRIGVGDYYPHAGSYKALLKECGLDSDSIDKRIIEKYKEVI